MRLSKEQLLEIKDLQLPDILNEMDNNQFNEYCKALFDFNDNFPLLETNLKNYFIFKDYDAFNKTLFNLHNLLENIHAAGFIKSCDKLFDELESKNYKMAEAHLSYFIEELTIFFKAVETVKQKSEMSLNKDQLLAVKGLNLLNVISEMDDNQYDEYCSALLAFIESFPVQEAKLKSLFNSKDYDAFSMNLSSIHDMLETIQAPSLAQSCNTLLDELGTLNFKIVEAHLSYLLVEISELSIDIQMIKQKGKEKKETGKKITIVEAPDVQTESLTQKSILAVDDVSLTLNSLRLALKDTNYKFTGVKSGMEALRFIMEHKPDLFILDVDMPVMNGYELASKIRKSGQTAPIIFLTGNAKQEYVIKAIEAGAVDFIVKPFNNEHVLEKIKKHIR